MAKAVRDPRDAIIAGLLARLRLLEGSISRAPGGDGLQDFRRTERDKTAAELERMGVDVLSRSQAA